MTAYARRRLARILLAVDSIDRQLRLATQYRDALYVQRNALTYRALHEAVVAGVPAGIRLDPNEPDWPVVQFELASGQVSWHVPSHTVEWDGHGEIAKSSRIEDYAAMSGISTPRARSKQRSG